MHQAGQPALPGVGQLHREKVSLRNRVGCAPPASCSPLRSIAGARRKNFTKSYQQRAQRAM